MKTLIKIMRSIMTSLLFVLLICFIILQFIFTFVKSAGGSISDLVKPEEILNNIDGLDENSKEITEGYIEDYINYVFHRRSYPSIQTIDLSMYNEEEQKIIIDHLNEVKSTIDIKYETVLKIRDIDSFFSNQALYLLINIGIIVLFIILVIVNGKIVNSLKLLSTSIISAGIISLILSSIFVANAKSYFDSIVLVLFNSIFDTGTTKEIMNLSLIYIAIGCLIFSIIYILNRLIYKKNKK